MSSTMSYRPNLPPSLLLADRTAIVDQLMRSAAFGAEIVLYILCMSYLLGAKRKIWWIIIYMTITFCLGTLLFALGMVIILQAAVDNRLYPTGIVGYWASVYDSPIFKGGNTIFLLEIWLADAVLLYRCSIVYMHNFKAMVIPACLWLSTIGVGSFLLFVAHQPKSSIWAASSVKIGTVTFSLTIAFNILVPLMIVSRVLVFRNRVRDVLGAPHVAQYTSVSAMLIESAALTAVTSLVFIIPYARHSLVATAFQGLTSATPVISSYLIILRVLQGRAWSTQTAIAKNYHTGSIRFAEVRDPPSSADRSNNPTLGYPLNDSSENGFKMMGNEMAGKAEP